MGSLPDERPDEHEIVPKRAKQEIEMLRATIERLESQRKEAIETASRAMQVKFEALATIERQRQVNERLLGIIGEHCGFGSATYRRAEALSEGDSTEPEEWECDRCGSGRWETRDIGQIYCQDCGTKGGIAIAG